MTPRDIRAAINGYHKRRNEEMELQIELRNNSAWLQGQYIAFAYHQPKKYPQKPWELKPKATAEMTDEAMEAWARSFAESYSNE